MTAGRGDATQPDPAVIERVAAAMWAKWRTGSGATWDDCSEAMRAGFRTLAEAAAAVIAAATAEQIAAAQRKRVAVTINGPLWAEGMLAAAKVAEQFARGFAAAGATTGEGEHASS